MMIWRRSLLRIALTCIIIGLMGNFILYFMGISPFNTVAVSENRSFKSDSINNIVINAAMDDIQIERISGDAITLTRLGSQSVQYSERLALNTSIDNGTLDITVLELKKQRFTINASYDVDLTLSVPDKIFEAITVTTITGDIQLNNIHSINNTLKSETGHVQVNGTDSRLNKIRTVTGDIELDGNTVSLDLNSTTGEIVIKLAELAGDIQANTMTGDITLYVGKPVKAVQTVLHTGTGKIRTDIAGLELSQDSDQFLARSLGEGNLEVQMSSENGDITFHQTK
ncbi:DUF4097 family beta strand repeat-containing protein [Paenibacillus segetis]|uniref:DUF4097 domain-containing protein n=1 Tax=Paenibacillus segetis TaxID=1325360 RepID=A0ABQ1YLH8_9BACL|nr:DUF4097 family beta strand repeat-containing protein [Paenibacillus segetis]GGH29032.1 hypothetical protein GCM10008013_31390 [Paenibacillus segetis]